MYLSLNYTFLTSLVWTEKIIYVNTAWCKIDRPLSVATDWHFGDEKVSMVVISEKSFNLLIVRFPPILLFP